MTYICNAFTEQINMKLRLAQIASIQTGVYAKADLQGNSYYLQARHFDDSGELRFLAQPDLFVDTKMARHILKDSDLLFIAKGSRNVAVIYRESSGKAVASSTFLVLRILDEQKSHVLSEYLMWFINHPRTQEKLKGIAKGSGIQSVALSDLANMEVLVPVSTSKTRFSQYTG